MLTESFDHPEPLSFQAFSWRKMHEHLQKHSDAHLHLMWDTTPALKHIILDVCL